MVPAQRGEGIDLDLETDLQVFYPPQLELFFFTADSRRF